MAPAIPMRPPDARPRLSLSNYVYYLSSNLSGRRDCARQLAERYETEYTPAKDPHAAWLAAAAEGRRTADDHLRLRRLIADQSDSRRASMYRALTAPYLGWLGGRPGEFISVGRAVWRSNNLDVSIVPLFGLRDRSGAVHVIQPYLRTAALTRDGACAAVFLLREHMDAIYPGGRPLVLDVRRNKSYTNVGRISRNFMAQLHAEADGLAALWRNVA